LPPPAPPSARAQVGVRQSVKRISVPWALASRTSRSSVDQSYSGDAGSRGATGRVGATSRQYTS
jgi:hypothetical protein